MLLFHAEQTTLVRAVIRQYAEAAIVLVHLCSVVFEGQFLSRTHGVKSDSGFKLHCG